MEIVLSKILAQIRHKEDKLTSEVLPTANETYQMTLFLKDMLSSIKDQVLQFGFKMSNRKLIFQEHQTASFRQTHLLQQGVSH